MIPTLAGLIARRVLLNFRADPDVVRRLVPKPLEVATQNGAAIVGVCLIRLEQLRPKGWPPALGIASENMAHRVAVRYRSGDRWRDGVFVWRRETDRVLTTRLGGRLFPGVHGLAAFDVQETVGRLAMAVRTEDRAADVMFTAQSASGWQATPAFPTFAAACEFFRRGDCGFSCSRDQQRLEGLQLRTLRWEMRPLSIGSWRAAFYEDLERFPPGSVAFDSALLMSDLPHEWHELDDLPASARVP